MVLLLASRVAITGCPVPKQDVLRVRTLRQASSRSCPPPQRSEEKTTRSPSQAIAASQSLSSLHTFACARAPAGSERFNIGDKVPPGPASLEQLALPVWSLGAWTLLVSRFYSKTHSQTVVAEVKGITADGLYDLDVKKRALPENVSRYASQSQLNR